MLVHIVMFKFNKKNRKTNIIQAKQMLENLLGSVPTLKSIDIGLNLSQEERSMDLSIVTLFESKEGLDTYAKHPEHIKVIDFIKSVIDYSKVVDYERD